MRILVFTHIVSGHFSEYMHHIFEAALSDSKNKYIFLTSSKFNNVKTNFEWPKAENINFAFLTEKEAEKACKKNLIRGAWSLSWILRKYVNTLDVDKVFLLWFAGLMPFLPLVLPRKVLISGILYRIHLYKIDEQSKIRNCIDNIRMRFIAMRHNIEKIYVLNDEKSVKIYNNLYGVDKFIYLPDPVPFIDKTKLKDLKEELGVEINNVIYLHFGAMDERKGTLLILQAIIEANRDKIMNSVFIFAGKVDSRIKEEFYELVDIAKQKCKILVFDRFCENEFLYNLCYTCNYILIPYSNTCQSSGVIGYASFFQKPVIGPSKGLLGNLIKDNHLGITMNIVDSHEIAKLIEGNIKYDSYNIYSENHSVEAFSKVLFC